jgi:hypothetical protein
MLSRPVTARLDSQWAADDGSLYFVCNRFLDHERFTGLRRFPNSQNSCSRPRRFSTWVLSISSPCLPTWGAGLHCFWSDHL